MNQKMGFVTSNCLYIPYFILNWLDSSIKLGILFKLSIPRYNIVENN